MLLLGLMGGILPVSLYAQTESFRIVNGIPHLPVLANTNSVSSPIPGMMIFSQADRTIMVYSGSAWDNFATTTNVASSSNSQKYFQVINGIPVLPVMPALTGAVLQGAMYYPSSAGGVRINNGQSWYAARDFIAGAEKAESKQVIAGRINNVDGMLVFPVLSRSPKDIEAGAVYITSRHPRMKVFDGTMWLELFVDQYPNTPVPPVKIGNTTWAPVNAGYDNTHSHGLMYQWHRKYGQEYESANTFAGPGTLSIGRLIASSARFYYSSNSPYDWCSPQQASWEMIDYNPCPVGWRVPTQSELTELNQAGSTWVDAGGPDDLPGRWYGGNHSTDRVGSVFLPASGQRDYSGGGARNRDANGYYWSSVSAGSNAVSLYLRDAYSDITTSYRASGYSVRCVKETYAATITSGGNPWFCAGGSVTLTASAGVSYLWSTGATTQSITVSNSGDYYVTITFPDGSSQTSASITVTSIPWNDSGILSGNQTVCVGQTTQFSSTKSGGTWSSENTSIASVGPYGEVQGLSPGTTTIRYSITGTCWYPTYRDVTVVALPVLGGVTTACVGATVNVTPGTGGTWTSSSTAVASVTNGGVVTAKVAGTTTLTFTNSTTGCSNTVTFTVKALPVIGGLTSVCLGQSTNLTPATGGTWTSSNTAVATVTNGGVVTGVSVGTVNLSFTNTTTGCSNQVGFTVHPQPLEPKVKYTCTFPGAGHVGEPYVSVFFSDLPVGGTVQILSPYTGGVDSYSSTTHEMTLFMAGGSVTYRVTTANGCSKDYVLDICCDTPFISDKSIETCTGFFALSLPGNGDIIPVGTTYSWNTPSAPGVSGGHAGIDEENVSDFGLVNTSFMRAPVSIVYTVTPKNGSCVGPSFNVTVLVKATPTINTVVDQTLCAGQSSNEISFSGSVILGTTYSWTNSNTAIGLADKGTGNIPSFVATNNTDAPITATITVNAEAFGCIATPRSFTITVFPSLKVPVISFLCGQYDGDIPNHRLVFTGLPAGGGLIIDKTTGIKYPFSDPNPSVNIDYPITGGPVTISYQLEDANGCTLDFSFTFCCPDKIQTTYKIFCIPEHVEGEMLVMAHAEVQLSGLPEGGTITRVRPMEGKEEILTGPDLLIDNLGDGTYTYLITDKDGCSKFITFTVNCDPIIHVEWEITRNGECAKDITSDIRIINLPTDYWRIMPGEIIGGTVNGGIYEMLKMNPGDYTYTVYNNKAEVLATLPVKVPYPSNGQVTNLVIQNEDCTKKTADLYFPEIPAHSWKIKIGSYGEFSGEGATYLAKGVPAGTHEVTIIDLNTNCQSVPKSITICK